MGFRTGCYATIWKVEPKGKWSNVQLSTSRKNQMGKYETDFSGFVAFIGAAHTAASGLQPMDRIRVGECEVTTQRDATKNVTYTNFKVFSFEAANTNGVNSKPASVPEGQPDLEEDPF